MDKDRFWQCFKQVTRSISASFPGAASLATAWSETESAEFDEHVISFLQHLEDELKNLEQKVDNPFHSENVSMLAKSVVEKIAYEKRSSNIKLYAKILSAAVLDGMFTNEAKWHHFVSLTERLSAEHVRVLNLVTDKPNIRFEEILPHFGISSSSKDWGILIAILTELQSTGLIAQCHLASPLDARWMSESPDWADQWRSTIYVSLELGYEFVHFIHDAEIEGNQNGEKKET